MLDTFMKILQMFLAKDMSLQKDTTIAEIQLDDNAYFEFILAILAFQATYNIDVPDWLVMNSELTMEMFVAEIAKLPREKDELFIARTFKIYVDLIDKRAFEDGETIN